MNNRTEWTAPETASEEAKIFNPRGKPKTILPHTETGGQTEKASLNRVYLKKRNHQ